MYTNTPQENAMFKIHIKAQNETQQWVIYLL